MAATAQRCARAVIEYEGTAFAGSQRQPNARTVQGVLEEALNRLTGERVHVRLAGRTDAGVHATGQVAHLDLARAVAPETLRNAINHHLRPRPIGVLEAALVEGDFHARFSATARHYIYRIVNRRAPLTLEANRAWQVPTPLDAEVMHEAAQRLVGHHDFTSFRSALCQAKSPVKTLDRLAVKRLGDRLEITALARSFLHHQVRNMVGTLKLIGEGRWPIERIEAVLAARDRAAAGPTAPACGLYLVRVDYSALTGSDRRPH
jgi:tRNA pseudouridine38-40 synthase